MNIGDAGLGAGGGVIGAILTWLGIKQRIDDQDKRMDRHEKRIECLEQDTVYKDQHGECSRAWHDALERLDRKMDVLLSRTESK